jgi:hypothetical protein
MNTLRAHRVSGRLVQDNNSNNDESTMALRHAHAARPYGGRSTMQAGGFFAASGGEAEVVEAEVVGM